MRVRLTVCAVLLCLAAANCRGSDAKTTLGGEIRLRGEGFDNLLDLIDRDDDAYAFYRMRTRLSLSAEPRDRLSFYFRLGHEYRWGRGEKAGGTRDAEAKIGIDNAWARIDGPHGLSVRFGRQDLAYGEGFLVMDGTPADGSSSAYFDAAVGAWHGARLDLDLIAAKMDEEGFGGEARDEDFYGLYARGKGQEFYLLHRQKRKSTAAASDLIHPSRRTTAAGGRWAILPETGTHFAFEGAYELGKCDGSESQAFGGYARGGWTGHSPRRMGCELGGLYLSGDDPKTARFEGWDGFYSEWPKYSELLVYSMGDPVTRIRPDDPGTWANMGSVWFEGRMAPHPKVKATLRATRLWAVERWRPGRGRDRGLLVATAATVAFAPDLQGQVLGEYFDPGSYYDSGSDPAIYGRWQIVARF